jgi:outer membrane receptor protein involved in Fe transport
MNLQASRRPRMLRRTALAVALSTGFAGIAFGQSTTGSIFGDAPVAPGETVLIQNATGLTREVPVDSRGRFVAGSLPLGDYTVTLRRDGQTVDTRKNVTLRVGAGTQVSFAAAEAAGGANAQDLSAITVNANALPAIDVTGVDSRTVITAEQLAKLPVARSAEAIAMLAPGVIAGSDAYTFNNHGVVSFGGSSVGENAYYINGFNTSDPLQNIGGITLPYGSIDQQEVLSGGYGAQYGRSDGGVISQVGKRGTNEWHFGAQILWEPKFARADAANTYYAKGAKAGQLYNYNNDDKSWTTTESAYFGGPLIKDKLFIFGAYEVERQQGSSIGSLDSPYKTNYQYRDPRWYAKIDWNINDSNILEITGASDKTSYRGSQYRYDYDTMQSGSFYGYPARTKQGGDMGVAKYTGYITDDLTISAMYGKMRLNSHTDYLNYNPDVAYVSGSTYQNPALNGGKPIRSSQNIGYVDPTNAKNNTTNLRFDVSYHLGDHTLSAGIDNLTARAFDVGQVTSGPGYWWIYDQAAAGDENTPISPSQGVGAPGGEGYFVSRYIYRARANARTVERAQYIQDSWQVTDRFLLNLGLRNDQFTNYNSDGQAYVKQTSPQWAPRVGFSWDVNGDSSFKVFGNAGRYYLALPNAVAIRGAGPSQYTNEYFTYTGIDPNTGAPTGLEPLGPGPVSPDGENGQTPDPRTVAAKDLKSEFQDEYILGFQKQLNESWVYGAKLTYRNLRNAIDDTGVDAILAAAEAQGIDTDNFADTKGRIFNPGRANDFVFENKDGTFTTVHVTNDELGFPKLKRKYYGAEFSLEHPFDGKWYASFNYLYSRSYGNTEGQVRTDISQTDVSATSAWDAPELMEYSNGYLSNDRKHQFKANGYYQITDEWLVGGNLAIYSGAPKSCLGSYGTDPDNGDPTGYGNAAYHWCNGVPQPPGKAGRLPWQYNLSANVEYRPLWADKKLAFNLYVFNLLNQQRPTLIDYGYGSSSATPDSAYERVIYRQTPRYVRFGVTYDF